MKISRGAKGYWGDFGFSWPELDAVRRSKFPLIDETDDTFMVSPLFWSPVFDSGELRRQIRFGLPRK